MSTVIESATGRAGVLVDYQSLTTPKRSIPGALVAFVKGGKRWECWYPLSGLVILP